MVVDFIIIKSTTTISKVRYILFFIVVWTKISFQTVFSWFVAQCKTMPDHLVFRNFFNKALRHITFQNTSRSRADAKDVQSSRKELDTLRSETFAGRNFRGFAFFGPFRESFFPRNVSKCLIREIFQNVSSAKYLKKIFPWTESFLENSHLFSSF